MLEEKDKLRKRIFEVIEVAEEHDTVSMIYDITMMLLIVLSLIPLAVKEEAGIYLVLDQVTAALFGIDYLLRLWTADLKLKKGKKSFFRYPFTFMALVDLFSILPSVHLLNRAFRSLKVLRMFRSFRVFRVIKAFRYSRNVEMIFRVFVKQKESLMVVGALAAGYILICALIVFNVEPETFPTFFDSIYWATISLTTVGYGDIYATSMAGRMITMLSSVFGIAVVALPAGILTAGYMEELRVEKERRQMRRLRISKFRKGSKKAVLHSKEPEEDAGEMKKTEVSDPQSPTK